MKCGHADKPTDERVNRKTPALPWWWAPDFNSEERRSGHCDAPLGHKPDQEVVPR